MAGDDIGTLLDFHAEAALLRLEFRRTHEIRVVRTRDGLRYSAERKPGAEGPYSLIGGAGEVRKALRASRR